MTAGFAAHGCTEEEGFHRHVTDYYILVLQVVEDEEMTAGFAAHGCTEEEGFHRHVTDYSILVLQVVEDEEMTAGFAAHGCTEEEGFHRHGMMNVQLSSNFIVKKMVGEDEEMTAEGLLLTDALKKKASSGTVSSY
ncbi:hypothetical protein LINPERHAP1_LOCUS7026 [Linum perenne]